MLAANTRLEAAPAAGQAFQPLPPPTGTYPFHLDLADVIGAAAVAAIVARGEIGFHMVGDTGGIVNPVPQENVAAALERDLTPVAGLGGFVPSFLYLLGDCIYFNGDPAQYYPQFYEPYTHYNLPIFAVPGNHDGDPATSANTSLDGFITNFCTPTPTTTKATGDSGRTTMTQPNVYWTLDTPYVTIIGLYTNVPEHGMLDDTQKAWLEHELATAPADRALIVTMHHPPYSADDFHSSSAYMQSTLDAAITASERAPGLDLRRARARLPALHPDRVTPARSGANDLPRRRQRRLPQPAQHRRRRHRPHAARRVPRASRCQHRRPRRHPLRLHPDAHQPDHHHHRLRPGQPTTRGRPHRHQPHRHRSGQHPHPQGRLTLRGTALPGRGLERHRRTALLHCARPAQPADVARS